MKKVGSINGPITTPFVNSYFGVSDFELSMTPFYAHRAIFLHSLAKKLSKEDFSSIVTYDKILNDALFSDYKDHDNPFVRKIPNVDILRKAHTNTNDISLFYFGSIKLWAKYILKEYSIQDKDFEPAKILSIQEIEYFRGFEEECIDEIRKFAKSKRIELTAKKSQMYFWFLIYRCLITCEYKTADNERLTTKNFCKCIGKGISHNSLDSFMNSATNTKGAPGKMLSSSELLNLNEIYYLILDKIKQNITSIKSKEDLINDAVYDVNNKRF